jgi:hypothetical protein|tara:strand:+ start:72 stop:275 length:204 start_codon:yes stop_codon:yes gene_type:complete
MLDRNLKIEYNNINHLKVIQRATLFDTTKLVYGLIKKILIDVKIKIKLVHVYLRLINIGETNGIYFM